MGRNILFITTDQQRYDALGCNGGTIARTPVVDALAARGLRYSRAYTQNVTCTPARVSMLNGQLPRTHGVVSCGRIMPAESPSIAGYLAERGGYRTALLGKGHFEPGSIAAERSFEKNLAKAGSTGPLRGFQHVELAMHGVFPDTHYGTWLTAQHPEHVGGFAMALSGGATSPETGAPEAAPNPIPRELYHTDWVADRTIAYLDGLDPDDDWFVWMSFPDPHHPWDPPAGEMHRVDWRDLDLPDGHPGSNDAVERILADRPAHWLRYFRGEWANIEGAPRRFVPSLLSHDAIREINAKAHVMNELVDEACGRVLRRIAERGWHDRTDVVFTTDHGELQGEYGFLYKGPFHTDALMRLPMVWAPAPVAGVQAGEVPEPVGSFDLPATFAAIAGLPVPEWSDGTPLPTTAGSGREHVLCTWDSMFPGYGMHLRSIFRDGWLCTAYEPSTVGQDNGWAGVAGSLPPGSLTRAGFAEPPVGPVSDIAYDGSEGELYHVAEDPHAFVNRWNDPACRGLRDELVGAMRGSATGAHALPMAAWFA